MKTAWLWREGRVFRQEKDAYFIPSQEDSKCAIAEGLMDRFQGSKCNVPYP